MNGGTTSEDNMVVCSGSDLPLYSLVSQQILLSEWHDEGGSIVTEMSE